MLATLGPLPVQIQPKSQAQTTRLRWFSTPPLQSWRGERVQISVGVWIVRYRHWVKPGSLDTAAELPDPPDADPVAPRSVRYAPAPWQRRSLCRRLPLDLTDPLFFGTEKRQAPEDLIVAVETARRVCNVCPVQRECLTHALAFDMRYGVWGGTSGKQREKMRGRLAEGASIEGLVCEWLG